MNDNIESLLRDPYTNSIAAELKVIYTKYGCPERPTGPTTDTGVAFDPANHSTVGDWGNNEEEAAQSYNDAIFDLFECADVTHVGSGLYITHYNSGTPKWQRYREEALEAINSWIAYYAWNKFCDDPYDILGKDHG